jgi:hypothetical protein
VVYGALVVQALHDGVNVRRQLVREHHNLEPLPPHV